MERSAEDWCERGDSNPHGFTRQILSLVRLPIPPLSRFVESNTYRKTVTAQFGSVHDLLTIFVRPRPRLLRSRRRTRRKPYGSSARL
jgi:hypothetical protein